MKTTIVPAQVTTVEDKITGSLGMSQLLLLITPIFIGSLLFVLLPPFFSYAPYKVALILILAIACSLLAIRIKSMILLMWLVLLSKYIKRPRYYIFNKNSDYLRETSYEIKAKTDIEQSTAKTVSKYHLNKLPLAELAKAQKLITHPSADFRLEINKKGKLRVHITEVQ